LHSSLPIFVAATANSGVHFLAFRAQEQCTEGKLWVN
jgi:hypothetical protein